MKYRSGQNKIKQEHGMVKELKNLLLEFADYDYVQAMIPGRIKPVKKAIPIIKIRSLMPTHNGFRALIQAGSAVQEVFFVGDSDKLKTLLSKYLLKPQRG